MTVLLGLASTGGGEGEALKQLREELEEELLTPEELALAALLSSTSTSTSASTPDAVETTGSGSGSGSGPGSRSGSGAWFESEIAAAHSRFQDRGLDRVAFDASLSSQTDVSRAASLYAVPRSQADALDDAITPLESVRSTRPAGETMNGLTLLRPRSPFLGWTHGSARILSDTTVRLGGPLSGAQEETTIEMMLADPTGALSTESQHQRSDGTWAWTSSVTAVARTADRSVGAGLDLTTNAPFLGLGLRITADFEEQEPWETTTATTTKATDTDTPRRTRRFAASAVTRLFGRTDDPLELVLGGAFQDANGALIDHLRHYILFANASAWSDARRIEIHARAGYEGLDEGTLGARSLQGRLGVDFAPFALSASKALVLGANIFGGSHWLDNTDSTADSATSPTTGRADQFGASAQARLKLGRLGTSWAFRIQRDRTSVPRSTAGSNAASSTSDPEGINESATSTLYLFTGNATLTLVGPLSLRVAARRNARIPSVFEQRARADLNSLLLPERTFTIEAGPELRTQDVRVDMIAFRQWIADGLTPTSNLWTRFKNDFAVAVVGVEIAATAKLTPRLDAEIIVGWADDDRSAEDRPVLSVTSRVLGDVLLRYFASPTFGAFSIHGQFASGPWQFKTPRASSTVDSGGDSGGGTNTQNAFGSAGTGQDNASIRVGIGWNVAFSQNVRFDLRVDNLFNQPYFVAPAQPASGPTGIDVRCALTMDL